MIEAATIVSLVGALGLGSILGQYAASGTQRRSTRADVLRALGDTESTRWVGPSTREMSFPEAMRILETAALLARVPRSAVLQYKVLATAAHWASETDYEIRGDDEYGGGIHPDFAALVAESATELSELIWSPHLRRAGLRRRIQVRATRFDLVDDESSRKTLARARDFIRA